MMTMMVVAAAAAYDVVSGVTLNSAAGGLWAGSTRRGDARQNSKHRQKMRAGRSEWRRREAWVLVGGMRGR